MEKHTKLKLSVKKDGDLKLNSAGVLSVVDMRVGTNEITNKQFFLH